MYRIHYVSIHSQTTQEVAKSCCNKPRMAAESMATNLMISLSDERGRGNSNSGQTPPDWQSGAMARLCDCNETSENSCSHEYDGQSK